MDENQFDTIYHEHFSYLLFYHGVAVFAASRPDGVRRRGIARPMAGRCASTAAMPKTLPSQRPRCGRCARKKSSPGSDQLASYGPSQARSRNQAQFADVPHRGAKRAASPSRLRRARARGTRCSTTAGFARIFSITPSTAARTSRVSSCRARISRSAIRTRSPRPSPTTC